MGGNPRMTKKDYCDMIFMYDYAHMEAGHS